VCSTAFNLLLLQTLACAVVLPPAPPAGAEAAVGAPARLSDEALRVLKKAWARARADARQFEIGPDDIRHRARKRLKRLRYAMEFVAPVLPRKPAREQLRALGRALDALGQFNDLQVAQAHFRQLAEPDAAAWFALGWIAARRGPALVEALRALKQLDKAPRVWRRDRQK
jgi:CHAD domain-containing protein